MYNVDISVICIIVLVSIIIGGSWVIRYGRFGSTHVEQDRGGFSSILSFLVVGFILLLVFSKFGINFNFGVGNKDQNRNHTQQDSLKKNISFHETIKLIPVDRLNSSPKKESNKEIILPSKRKGKYGIQIGAYEARRHAEKKGKTYSGLKDVVITPRVDNYYKVIVGFWDNKQDAIDYLDLNLEKGFIIQVEDVLVTQKTYKASSN